MRYEEPTWTGPYFGQFGVLADDGDKVQCHVCGDMYDLLGSHANKTHGLTADWYRQAFGLYQATSLVGPTFSAKRSRISTDHLRQVGETHRERTRNLTTEQRKTAMANVARRKQHDLNPTPPERMHAVREALYGDPRGHTDGYLIEVTDMFLAELERGQRGVRTARSVC